MADELGARRRRLRRALKPWRASLVEFVLLGGWTLGLLGPLLVAPGAFDWRLGLAPPVLFVAGYLGLDAWRQRGDAAGSSRGQDFAALGLAVACAALGFFLYASAAGRPSPTAEAPVVESFVPSEAPAALETDIVN